MIEIEIYRSVRDWVTNNQGAMKKEELHTLFTDDLRAVTDYKKIYFVSEDRRGKETEPMSV
jgi:hypothetical protein